MHLFEDPRDTELLAVSAKTQDAFQAWATNTDNTQLVPTTNRIRAGEKKTITPAQRKDLADEILKMAQEMVDLAVELQTAEENEDGNLKEKLDALTESLQTTKTTLMK